MIDSRESAQFEQPITLESHLWEAANILRGSPVDRTDWKSYILPLLFYKRICDVWDEEYEETVAAYGEDFGDEYRFQIPEACHWRDVRATPTNVGTALQNALRGIEAANQKHLYGVFGDAQWTNKDRLPDPLLKDLIEHFSALRLGNRRVASDIIGDAYEYLIKKFADATNNKAGEFYTPRSVVRLMVDILDPQEGETIYDPACGTGGMLLAAVAHAAARGGDPRTFFGRLFGQEKNLTTASVARMNLLLHGIEDFVVERGDTLRSPVFTDPATGGLATFDCVIANPPFSLERWGREIWENDPWGRAFAGLPTDSSGDFAWVRPAHRFQRRLRLGAAHGGVNGRWQWAHGRGAAARRAFPRRRRGPDPALSPGARLDRGGGRPGAQPVLRHRTGSLHPRPAPAQGPGAGGPGADRRRLRAVPQRAGAELPGAGARCRDAGLGASIRGCGGPGAGGQPGRDQG